MRYAQVTDQLAGLGSEKWILNAAAKRRQAEGHRVINLTIGEPDVPTPDSLIETACTAMRAGRTGYSNGRGEPVLLDALSRRYTTRLNRPFGHDRFLCLPGTQTSLYLVFRTICEPGCEVILGDPMYATYEGIIRASGAVPVPVRLKPEQNFRLQAADVAAAITPATRAVFLNTPHNPTGAILQPGELRALGELARAHDLWIVSDEVYGDLTHDGRPFTSALADPEFEERTIITASISKSHAAPGFRSGWAVGPADFTHRALPLSETMLFGSQPFIADMTAEAIASAPVLAQGMAARMARRAQILFDRLDGVAGLRVHRPEAGMFALIDIRALSDNSLAFALELLEATDVAMMPGASFGLALEGWLRVALNASDADTEEACARIAAYAMQKAA
ncbi:pyridoxal phosphate-dependent aminotransferase [Pararhodobacter aggregans]|uniref:aspartate transaminase n=1 Tax=Pararhodobacter aggregans TaxID=404875 RepID=A0A2T7UVA8_9RHOB|nr:aminotransferase class I/II-fold pyridoxal phosphate-dependent enzyme [Pararhodobacter aggregans]PTX03812.1 arginine:pyruvate transaminase [Pararhodobacter aggregans]PVE48703.1 aminotransferase [Pararhodobacter aggregans]